MPFSHVAVVVPARLQSTRLPRKLLASVRGRPVLAWTLEALKASHLPPECLFLATADEALAAVARDCGVQVLPTPAEASSGSHRVALASTMLPPRVRWVVNVQGDEPLLDPAALSPILAACEPGADLVTGVCAITPSEWHQPSTVKALVDCTGHARWFSRSPLPHRLSGSDEDTIRAFLAREAGVRRHLGIYAFPRHRLLEWPQLQRTAMASEAGLEQLDALLAGWTVRAVELPRPRGPSVDTAADLEAVRRAWAPPTAP